MLERLEAEFAASLLCTPCTDQTGEAIPATHVIIMRRFCAAGAPLPEQPFGREWLVCEPHARLLATATIGEATQGLRGCSGCRENVTKQTYAHVIARIEPIAAPQ
jgi:hypothetical protein